ncbi:hypothetical protein GALL_134620 [mine drainage metagenome]|uniref:PilZ domain-containing protein n=1 Tax=mine drainage metagenome TaxID=410659 RepID=A0A1J5SWX9_9ZZZZ
MQFIQNIFKKFSQSEKVETFSWLSELKGMDDVSAIKFCAEKLNADFQKNVFNGEQNLNKLFQIDEKTHTIVERITTHYVNIDHINTELEERIENTVYLYHRQLFLIYLHLIENLVLPNHDALPTMLARAISNATQMIKWRYYSYQSAPANVWLQLAKLYMVAEQRLLLDDSIEAYIDQKTKKISTAYIEACMLGTLESLSLKCQQIELASNMLAAWAEKTTIDKIYNEEKHLFFVDTVSNTSAKRIRNFKPADTYRYWCFDDFNINIELCLSLIEFNIVPQQHTVKEFIKNPYALSTLEVLRTEWSRLEYKRQRRSEDRYQTAKLATTAFGFEEACYQIEINEKKQMQGRRTSTLNDNIRNEKPTFNRQTIGFADPNIIYMDLGESDSNIVDESSKGLGFHISKHANEVSLGMMVCITVKEKESITKIGTIRSIRPIAGGKLHIGVEVFSASAIRVEATAMSLNVAPHITKGSDAAIEFTKAVTTGFACLFLPRESNISMQETLIFPKYQFNKNELYKINISGNSKVIKSNDILEQREDWVRTTFAQAS